MDSNLNKIERENQWIVAFTNTSSYNSTTAQGPFESKEIAEEFAKIWNRKREEFIEKTLEEDTGGDYEFEYIIAKAVELHLSYTSKQILEEIENFMGVKE